MTEETIPIKGRKEYVFQELSNVLSQIDSKHDYTIFPEKHPGCGYLIGSSTHENYFFVTVIEKGIATGTKKPVKKEFVYNLLCGILPINCFPNDLVTISKEISDRKKENSWIKEYHHEKTETELFVYFIQSEMGGAIKIGFSRNPEQRLNELQPSTPYELRLLATIRGDPNKEKELHRRFADDCIRNEWFSPSDKLLSFIEQIKGEKE